MLLFTPVFALAQTASDQQLIEQLRAQIASLQARLEQLLQTQAAATPTAPSCPTQIFTYSLYLGQSDSSTQGQVSALQKFLAQYPAVYPEGLVTGYFGPLTERAVQRFQAQYGIVSSGAPDTTGYGVVGPATKEKIQGLCPAPNGSGTTPIGGLSISPDSANMKVGDTAVLRAFYQPPQPPCPTGLYCAQVLPSPYPVEAVWTSSNPQAATVSWKPIPCPSSVPPTNAGCFDFTTVEVTGVSPGSATLTASYQVFTGVTLTATAQVNVVGFQALPLIVLSADKNSGRSPLTVNFTATLFSFPSCGRDISWDFGDGTAQALSDSCFGAVAIPPSQTITTSHAYSKPGTYTVSVTVNRTQSNIVTISVAKQGSVVITSLTPPSGPIGTVVTIKGSGLSLSADNRVNIRSASGNVGTITGLKSSDGVTLQFTMPSELIPYCRPPIICAIIITPVVAGVYNIDVVSPLAEGGEALSNSLSFTISPTSGPITVLSPNGGEQYSFGTTAYSFAHWKGPTGKGYKVTVLSNSKLSSWGIADSYGGTPNEDYYMSWLVGKVFDANYQLLDLAAGNYYLRVQTVVDGVTISDDSDAPFSIVSSTIGSLTVTRNTNVNPTFYPGSVNAQIGSYVLTASPAEAVNLSTLTLYLRTTSSQDIGNVRVFIGGTQVGNARATILGGYDVASFAAVSPINIAARGSKQVDAWADILPSAVTGMSPALTTLASCLGTGAATGAVIYCSPTEVAGWGVNIASLSGGGAISTTETNLASILSAIQAQLSAIAETILQLQR